MTTTACKPALQTERVVLKHGIVVLVVENPTADIVSTRCFWKGGSKLESAGQAGLSNLIMNLITRGTTKYSSQEIAEQVEFLGASLGTEATADYFLLSAKTVSADFAKILSLAAEIVRYPSFPDSEIELERRLTLQAIKSQRERPFAIAYECLQGLVYGSHPYGFPSLGTADTIAKIDRPSLVAFHQTYFRPDQMVISVAGRVTVDGVIAVIEQAFGDWQVAAPLPVMADLTNQFLPQTVKICQDTQQSIVMLGYAAPTVYDPDYAPLKLIATYLGNGLSSRLFVELREKRGLAYEVSAFYPTRQQRSQFVAYIGTAPHNTETAQAGLLAECDRLSQQLLDSTELQTTKSKLLGQYALGKQTNGQIAQILGWYETLELGVAFDSAYVDLIEAVTLADIQRTAQTHLTTPAITIVGPT